MKPDEEIEEGSGSGVAAVNRALAILAAFQADDTSLSLADLAARTGLNKSTILRLAESLVNGRLLLRVNNGQFRIGSEALRLGALYQQAHNVGDVLLPGMRWLAGSTGESVVFHVREGSKRVCLLRIESDQPIRYHVREGDIMPLEVGSCGRVLLGFSGEAGEPYEAIRRDFYYISMGERAPDTAGIAAPVFGPRQELIGALGVSGPSSRLTMDFAIGALPGLLAAAKTATHDLGGDSHVFNAPLAALRNRGAKAS